MPQPPPVRSLVIAGTAALGGVVLLLFSQVHALKQQIGEREQRLAMVTAQNDTFKQQLMELDGERTQLEAKLNELRAQVAATAGERDRVKAETEELQSRIRTMEEDASRLQGQLQQAGKERDDLTVQVAKLQSEKASIEQSAGRLRNRLAFLDRDYQQISTQFSQLKRTQSLQPLTDPAAPRPDGGLTAPGSSETPVLTLNTPPSLSGNSGALSSMDSATTMLGGDRPSIELAPIVVRRSQAEVLRSLRAQVVEVNDVHRFVVLNKGSSDGVQMGMTFDLLRGGSIIGQVVVIRLQPQLAACEIVGEGTALPEVGDLAIKSAP